MFPMTIKRASSATTLQSAIPSALEGKFDGDSKTLLLEVFEGDMLFILRTIN